MGTTADPHPWERTKAPGPAHVYRSWARAAGRPPAQDGSRSGGSEDFGARRGIYRDAEAAWAERLGHTQSLCGQSQGEAWILGSHPGSRVQVA